MALLRIESLVVYENGRRVIDGLSFTVNKGEQWAIVGPSGTGKTTLLHAMAGRHQYSGAITIAEDLPGKMVLVEQQHRFRTLSNTQSFYYQQRYNSSDSEDSITVSEDLRQHIQGIAAGEPFSTQVMHTVSLLRLDHLLEAKLIQLSNGENKRLQLAKALLLQPAILLLDNPFTGLDVAARQTLQELLAAITAQGIHVILVTALGAIPSFITHVLQMDEGFRYLANTADAYRSAQVSAGAAPELIADKPLLDQLTAVDRGGNFTYAVRLKNLNITYGERRILKDISWEVRKGERWSLSGPNGSGKSTLLSVVCADNPQSYANEVYMFDRKRGTGESIWDIKQQIGFVSPELHLYFESGTSCFDVVASGIFDTIGLFRMLNEQQELLVSQWMKLLGIESLSRKMLFQLSNSEQRLVLLTRALVKNPPLLVLDEPCQGLDAAQVQRFRTLVDEICLHTGKTLIYVSHYPEELPSCVTRYIRLQEGVASID